MRERLTREMPRPRARARPPETERAALGARFPRVHRWWPRLLGAAIAGAALWALCDLGGIPVSRATNPFEWVRLWLESAVQGLAAVFTGKRGDAIVPWWQRLVVIGLAIWLGDLFIRQRRARLAFRPGPVNVAGFGAPPGGKAGGGAGGEAGGGAADECAFRTSFMTVLSETQIYPPYAGPTDPPPSAYLDVFAEAGSEKGSVVAMALQALSRLRPRVGYHVSGTLVARPTTPHCGVSVSVTSFDGKHPTSTEILWADTWDGVARRAAYWVLATILPCTKLVRQPPWRTWANKKLPDGLFEAYNEGKRLQDEFRLDEALVRYEKALTQDPLNSELRLMVASVQEELGLFLEALKTYEATLNIGAAVDAYTTHLWRHPYAVNQLWSNLRYVRRHPNGLGGRYRYACTLAFSEITAQQWVGSDPEAQRARADLAVVMSERYARVAPGFDGDQDAARDWALTVLRSTEHVEAVRVIFQLAAAQEFARLRDDALLLRLMYLFKPSTRRTLPPSLLVLFRDVWAPLRAAAAWTQWERAGFAPRPAAEGSVDRVPDLPFDQAFAHWPTRPRQRAARTFRTWPPRRDDLSALLRRPLRWPTRIHFTHFYNGACVYAFALQAYVEESERGPDVRLLTDTSVAMLRNAVAGADSGFATRRRRWILSGDPDLAALRYQSDFARFEHDLFPTLRESYSRPRDVVRLRVAAYSITLVEQGTGAMAQTWQRRYRDHHDDGIPISTVRSWLDEDLGAWQALVAMAENEGARRWCVRVDFVTAVRASTSPDVLKRSGFPPPVPRFHHVVENYFTQRQRDQVSPSLDRVAGPDRVREIEQVSASYVDDCYSRLAALAELAHGSVESSGPGTDGLLSTWRDDARLEPEQASELLKLHTRLWLRAAEIMNDSRRARREARVPSLEEQVSSLHLDESANSRL